MAAISKISIDGFKAFPKDFELNLDGKNLLMYGENGSGKSSIYYALHALLQSQCKDKCNIYFSTTHPESIVNKYTNKPDAKVEIKFEGSDVVYSISQAGYNESTPQATSPLRDLNGKCVFINHKFLFNVFSFRNSQYIDLFPVFIKDILPFTLTRDKSKYISELYDEAVTRIKRKGRGNKIDEAYKNLIKKFNEETEHIIGLINQNAVSTATDIFNNNFRDIGDRKLKISLEYNDNRDDIPQPNKSYWLRLGYRYQLVEKAGVMEKKTLSTGLEVLQPSIMLKVEELQDDDITYVPIEKPQTYFNEAKLTAIALSIRFALLNTVDPADGRFLALDDMLISLDMSNRMKVITFLLNKVASSYKLYVFTHDRLFYHTFKRKIETQYKKADWFFGGLYINDSIAPNEPSCVPDNKSKIEKIEDAYKCHDYFRCGTLLRQECERCLSELLPDSFRIKADPNTGASISKNLDEQICSLEEFCKHEQIDYTPFRDLKTYKDLFLNSTAHNDITSPFYRNEIKTCKQAITSLAQLNRTKTIPCRQDFYFDFQAPDGKNCRVSMRRRELIKLLEHNGQQRISYYSKCEIRKIVVDGADTVLNEWFESINQAYSFVCQNYNCPSNLVLLDILKDRDGYLKDKI